MRKLNTVLCDDAAIMRARKRASLNPKLARPITANLAQTVMGYIQSSLDDFRDKETPEIKQKLTSMPIPGKFKTDSFASKIKECIKNGDLVGLAGVVEDIVRSLMSGNRSGSLAHRRPIHPHMAARKPVRSSVIHPTNAKVANIVQTVMGIIQPALDSFKNKEVTEIKQKLNTMPIPGKFKTDAFASEVKNCAQTGNASSLSGIIESLAQSLTPGKPVRSSVMPAKRKRAMDEQWLLEQAINRVVSEYPDADLDETASRVSELSGFSIVDAVKALTLMEVGADDSISVDYPMEEGAPAMDDMGGEGDFMDDFADDNGGDFSEEEEFPLEEEMENSGEEVSIEDAPEEGEDEALEEEPEDEESEEEVKTSSLRRKAILKSQNPQQIAKDFISLPATALPRADTDNEDISAWDIVEAIASGDTDGFSGEGVYLTADCEGWKEGVRLSIIPDKAAARGRYGYGYGPQPTTVSVTSSLRRKSSTARRKRANDLSVGTRVYVPMEDAYGKVEQGMGEDGRMSILFDDGDQGYYSADEVEVSKQPKTSSRKKALMGFVQPILYIMQEIAQVSAEESFEARKRETHATAPQDMEIPGGFEWGSLSSEIIGEATERGIDIEQAMPVIDNWIENNSTDVDSILSLDMESRINWAAGTMAARYEEAMWQDPSNFGSDEDMIDPGDLDVEEDLILDGDIHMSSERKNATSMKQTIMEIEKVLKANGISLTNNAYYWDCRRTYGDYSLEVLNHLKGICEDNQIDGYTADHDGDMHTSDLHRTGEGDPMEQLQALWKKLSMKPEYADNSDTEKLLNAFETQAKAEGFSEDEVNDFYDLIGPQ